MKHLDLQLRFLVVLLVAATMALPSHAARQTRKNARKPASALESGLSAMKMGNFVEARAIFRKLHEQEPKNGLYLFNLGSAEFNLKAYPAAVLAFRTVVDLKGPLAPAAKLFLVKALRKNSDLSTAELTLRSLEQEGTLPAAHIAQELHEVRTEQVRWALQNYKQNRFENALDYLQGDFKQSSLYLFRGLMQIKLGRTQEAGESFRLALEHPNEGDSHTQARFFLDLISTRQGDSTVWAFGDLGLGYNSNLYLDGKSESPVGKFTAQLNASIGVQWLKIRPWLVSGSYTLYWEETPGAASGRFFSHSLRAPMGINGTTWLVQVTPLLQFQTLETQPYLLKGGASARIRKRFEDVSLTFQYEWLRQFAQVSGASYLDGRTHAASLTAGYLLGQSYLEAGLLVLIDDIGDLVATDATVPLAGRGIGPQLRGIWYPTESSEVELSIAHLSRSYRRLALPGNVERSDTQQRANFRITYTIAPFVRGYVNCAVLFNSSSLTSTSGIDDKNYTQIVTLAGVTWEILN